MIRRKFVAGKQTNMRLVFHPILFYCVTYSKEIGSHFTVFVLSNSITLGLASSLELAKKNRIEGYYFCFIPQNWPEL